MEFFHREIVSIEARRLARLSHCGKRKLGALQRMTLSPDLGKSYADLTAHLTQAALAVFGGFPPFFEPSRGDPKRVAFDPNRLSGKNRRKPPFLLGSDGITFFRFPTG
jgi:hypothetical protein